MILSSDYKSWFFGINRLPETHPAAANYAPPTTKKHRRFIRRCFLSGNDYSCFWALIFTPGPMVEAVTQERMYWPFAAAGLALMMAPSRAA